MKKWGFMIVFLLIMSSMLVACGSDTRNNSDQNFSTTEEQPSSSGVIKANDIVGDWYLGKSGGYRYIVRIYKNGALQYIQAKEKAGIITHADGTWELENAVKFQIDGFYEVTDGVLYRNYPSSEVDSNSTLITPAELSLSDNGQTLWLYYSDLDLIEYMTLMDEEMTISILLGVQDGEECTACDGTGVSRYKTEYAPNYTGSASSNSYEIPVFCPVCGGSGYVLSD